MNAIQQHPNACAALPPPWLATRAQVAAAAEQLGCPIVFTLGVGWGPIPPQDVPVLAAAMAAKGGRDDRNTTNR